MSVLIERELLAELARAKLEAEVAAQHVEILTLKIAVRYRLPDGARWDASGLVILPPPPAPKRGEPVAAEVPIAVAPLEGVADAEADAEALTNGRQDRPFDTLGGLS